MNQLRVLKIAALLFGGGLGAAGTASAISTLPLGYVTKELGVGFNMVGVNIHHPILISGIFEGASGTTLTDTEVDFGTVLTEAAGDYLLEITDGAMAGTVAEIEGKSGNTITLPSALAVAGAKYSIRKAFTLEEFFGTGEDASLTGSFSSSAADIVWVPNAVGGYSLYFFHSSSNAFRSTLSPFVALSSPIKLFYPSAVLVQIKTMPATVRVLGEVKKYSTAFMMQNGFNLITVPSPTGQSLDESRLQDSITTSFSSSGSDLVWVPNGTGGYLQYFYSSSGNQWRSTASPFSGDQGGTVIKGAVLIQRKSGAGTGDFKLPEYFETL